MLSRVTELVSKSIQVVSRVVTASARFELRPLALLEALTFPTQRLTPASLPLFSSPATPL